MADSCPYQKLFLRESPILRNGNETAIPSGKFWSPIPTASATAPPMLASGSPAATPPNNTPTANPSGMLCRVMAKTNSMVLFNLVWTPSVFSCGKFKCKCGRNLSSANKNNAPIANPAAAGKAFVNPSPGLISMAGASSDQKLAAIITPPVNPSIPSRALRFKSFTTKTNEAPSAVTNQVNVVAIRAA